VLFTYDRAAWSRLKRRLAPIARAAVAAAAAGDLVRAAERCAAYLAAIEREVGAHARRLAVYADMDRLRASIASATGAPAPPASERPAACANALEGARPGSVLHGDVDAVVDALGRCRDGGRRPAP